MKKILSSVTIPLIVLSTFSILASEVKAQHDIVSFPSGCRSFDDPSNPTLDESRLLIDLEIAGQGQIVYANPGETVYGTCTYQIYSGAGNPSEINQGFFIMSWTPNWPAPDGYYIPVWNGISGVYPGVTDTASFSFTAPTTPGTYYLYWCGEAHYSMRQAVDSYNQDLGVPGTPAHAKIIVEGTVPPPPDEMYSLPAGAKHWVPSDPVLDETCMLFDLDIEGSGQVVYANLGQTLSGVCTFQRYSGSGNPNEIQQAFFIMSWTPNWPAPDGYYIPIYNEIPGVYPGITQTTSFSFTAPTTPGTYYLYWCRQSHYSIRQAVDTYDQPLTLQAHAKIVVDGFNPWDDDDNDDILNFVETVAEQPYGISSHDYFLERANAGSFEIEFGGGYVGFSDPLSTYDEITTWASAHINPDEGVAWSNDVGDIIGILYLDISEELLSLLLSVIPKGGWVLSALSNFASTCSDDNVRMAIIVNVGDPTTDIDTIMSFHTWSASAVQPFVSLFTDVWFLDDDNSLPNGFKYTRIPELTIDNLVDAGVGIVFAGLLQKFGKALESAVEIPKEVISLAFRVIYDNIKTLIFNARCPIDILITDPVGNRVGYDPTFGTLAEIEGAFNSGNGTEPQMIIIPSVLPGVYVVEVFGTGTGNYGITIESIATNGTIIGSLNLNGTTFQGKIDMHSITIKEDNTVVPEFPSTMLLPLFMLATLLALMLYRRRHST